MHSSAVRNMYGGCAALRAATRRRAPATVSQSLHTTSIPPRQPSSCLHSRSSFCTPRTPSFTHHARRTARPYSSPSRTPPVVFADPNRPDLFYHLVPAPTPVSHTLPAFALSFLSEPPRAPDAPSVIGWLPAQTADAPADSTAGLRDFKENRAFRELLHATVRDALRAGADAHWAASAVALQAGWMHIHDQRNVPAPERVGDPDDIIGSVLVKDGEVQPDTYSPMPAYRVCTADGVLQLTDGLARALERALAEANRA